ncbi:hypothetical protein Tco_0126233, partial [Tanacetum coccineum]
LYCEDADGYNQGGQRLSGYDDWDQEIELCVELHGDQGNRIAEVFQDSNNAAAVAQKKLKDKKLEEKKKQTG